jgi:dTDP-4-dehydrorhamnose 3,5-epimerase
MHFIATEIGGAWIIDPTPHQDNRGRFFRTWCMQEFQEHGLSFVPVQANMGLSTEKGTVRGMHFQAAPAVEAKLVRCTRGRMFDVVLDLRANSPTFLKWHGVELTPENGRMLLVPENCAHGYQTLEPNTEMSYMTTAFYAPASVRGARHDDPAFAIRWPLPPTIVSDQDRAWPLLSAQQPGF